MRSVRLPVPTVPEILDAPEPAILVLLPVLDAALEVVLASVAAAHPELHDDSRPPWHPPLPRHARIGGVIATHAHRLRRALRRYQRAIRHDRLVAPVDDTADREF